MKVGELVKRSPVTIDEGTNIIQAAKYMVNNKVGLLVIVDPYDKGKIKGVVSERDIVRAVANNLDLSSSIMDIATKEVVTVDFDALIDEAALLMSKHSIRHLVVTKEDKLYGVVSMRDIVGEDKIIKVLSTMVF
jgi:signal-transduction protein with cAMP-binding, CBS, and nucleotidyltransferase domain